VGNQSLSMGLHHGSALMSAVKEPLNLKSLEGAIIIVDIAGSLFAAASRDAVKASGVLPVELTNARVFANGQRVPAIREGAPSDKRRPCRRGIRWSALSSQGYYACGQGRLPRR